MHKYMLFSNQQNIKQVKIANNNVKIKRLHKNTFLGVLTDPKLCWKLHINHIKTKIAKSIALLYRGKHILNQKSLYIWYCFLILPYTTYLFIMYKVKMTCFETVFKDGLKQE